MASHGVRAGEFRADIQGLRAVAVLMVLAFHAGAPGVPGGFAGVDVFFVISGFLITGLLVREVEGSRRLSLRRFYARRAKRLLPAASVVLGVTALLTWLFVPRIRWAEIGGDLVAAAVYVVNWRLADRSVDYLAEDSAASPVQHYWSLAVEEQFYLVWPLLIVLGGWLVTRYGWPVRRVLGVLLATVVVCSFAWSVHLTAVSEATAYFVSTTRLWELGVGGLVALGAPVWSRVNEAGAALLAWAGSLALVACALILGPGSSWPGYAAALPTLGTAALIAGGYRARLDVLSRFLCSAPMQRVGALSYSLYLWHWPLLVIAAARWGELSVWQGVAVALFSFVPSALTYALVESPARQAALMARVPVALAAGVACTLVGVASGAVLVEAVERSVQVADPGQAVGAGALVDDQRRSVPSMPQGRATAAARRGGAVAPAPNPAVRGPNVEQLDLDPESITPDPLRATQDLPSLHARGCQGGLGSTEVVRCDAGDPDGKLRIAVVGDSKIVQWGDALGEVAESEGWRLRTYLRASCPWTAATVDNGGADETCTQWGVSVRDRLVGRERPDVVLVSGVKPTAFDGEGRLTRNGMIDGYVEYWSELAAVGVPVIALADTPSPGALSVFACVAEHREDVSSCTFGRNDGAGTRALRAAVSRVPAARLVSMNDWVCPLERCPPVIGNVLVYRQGSHITNTYARTLTRPLRARLAGAVAAAMQASRATARRAP